MSNRIGDILIRIIMTVCYIASYPVLHKIGLPVSGSTKRGTSIPLTAVSGMTILPCFFCRWFHRFQILNSSRYVCQELGFRPSADNNPLINEWHGLWFRHWYSGFVRACMQVSCLLRSIDHPTGIRSTLLQYNKLIHCPVNGFFSRFVSQLPDNIGIRNSMFSGLHHHSRL